MAYVDWSLQGHSIANCNCDFGCPCQFNTLPTHGDCRAMTAVKIDKGHFGDVDLSGLVAPRTVGNGRFPASFEDVISLATTFQKPVCGTPGDRRWALDKRRGAPHIRRSGQRAMDRLFQQARTSEVHSGYVVNPLSPDGSSARRRPPQAAET